MLATNLKVLAVVLGTILLYTALANAIPQVESEVPEELALGADFSAAELVAAGERLYHGAGGCTACHGLGTRAPNLLGGQGGPAVGARCGQRVPGMECKAYLRQSLTEPNAHLVEGFEPIMPDMSRTLSPTQIWALIAFLQSQEGEVTVSAADLESAPAGQGGAQAGAAAAAPAAAGGSTDPATLLSENQCLACHKLGAEGGPIGPPLDGVGARLGADGIRRAILLPNADTAAGYEAVAGTMPATFGQQLTAAQLEALVEYLTSQR